MMKKVSLAVCGIFLLMVSTVVASGSTNVANAQSTGGGVSGQGNLGGSPLSCLTVVVRDIEISFSASTGSTGSINSGEFSITGIPAIGGGPRVTPWSGSISGGTFSTTSYQLTGVHVSEPLVKCAPLPGFPNVGEPVTISGNCGNNVPIQFSSSNGVITGTFTGNVQCIVPVLPIPTPPPDTDCTVPPSPDVITGTEGSDILTGTIGNDLMLGLGGNDRMNGLGGNDRMNGCGGNDSVNGNAGNDGITGGIGNDAVSGGDGDDNVQGGEGNDIVSGDGGTNTLTGGLGRDRFICGSNGDTVTDFQPGQDSIVGTCILGTAPPPGGAEGGNQL